MKITRLYCFGIEISNTTLGRQSLEPRCCRFVVVKRSRGNLFGRTTTNDKARVLDEARSLDHKRGRFRHPTIRLSAVIWIQPFGFPQDEIGAGCAEACQSVSFGSMPEVAIAAVAQEYYGDSNSRDQSGIEPRPTGGYQEANIQLCS